jgi:hypothetical protein
MRGVIIARFSWQRRGNRQTLLTLVIVQIGAKTAIMFSSPQVRRWLTLAQSN